MTQDYRKFLRPEELARVSRLEIRARNVVEGFLSGLHRSPHFGQTVEFVQHREYVPGDDPRTIDWKVWSKTDKYYIKQFEADTNLRTTILVDVSESMQFGAGAMTKHDYACTVAAALSYLLLRQHDAVKVATFDEDLRDQLPWRSSKNHLHAILAALGEYKASGKTEISNILRRVAERQSRRGMIVIVSDLFVDQDDLFKGLQLLRQRGHDVLVLHILDDAELDFEFSGTTKFEGMEETGDLVCDPRALRAGYMSAMQEFLEKLRRECARQVVDYQTVRTSEHLDAALAHYVANRIGVRRSA